MLQAGNTPFDWGGKWKEMEAVCGFHTAPVCQLHMEETPPTFGGGKWKEMEAACRYHATTVWNEKKLGQHEAAPTIYTIGYTWNGAAGGYPTAPSLMLQVKEGGNTNRGGGTRIGGRGNANRKVETQERGMEMWEWGGNASRGPKTQEKGGDNASKGEKREETWARGRIGGGRKEWGWISGLRTILDAILAILNLPQPLLILAVPLLISGCR